MIFLFTDYGLEGPYIGQVETVLYQLTPNEKVTNLMADAPRNNPEASAYLLASLICHIPEGSILFCVVDPGVGTDEDKPAVLNIDGRWFVGPDNGLFDIVAKRAGQIGAWEITWQPDSLSNSFHGRDLYAPVCAMLVNNEDIQKKEFGWCDRHDWPDDLYEVIYIDHFGNCMTGIRSSRLSKQTILSINDIKINHASTFGQVAEGQAFWYQNSNGLIEIAVNKASAAQQLQLSLANQINIIT